MKKPTKSGQGDMNTFTEENDDKIVEKQTVIIEEAEITASTSGDLIADRIDEAVIQAEAVMAVSKSAENTTVNPGDMKPSNLEIEAFLSNALIRDGDGLTIDPINYYDSLSACQLAAYLAEKTSAEAQEIVVEGQDLMETISLSMQVLQSNMRAFYVKASVASERGTDTDYDNRANFYRLMASKCESSAKALEYRARSLEIALNNVEECKTECFKYAVLAKEIIHDLLKNYDESKRLKSLACSWTYKAKIAIIDALMNEREALLLLKGIWSSLQDDMIYVERANNSADDSDNVAQCENTDRRTKIGHIVFTCIGLYLFSATKLFKAGSDLFNETLALALLTIGWCAVYWLHKLYMYLRFLDDERTAIQTIAEGGVLTEPKDEFLEDCDRKLETLKTNLLTCSTLMDFGPDSIYWWVH